MRSILIKCVGEGKDVQRALYKWRNAPLQHGFSPAQLMFGRSQNTLFPQPAKAFAPIDLQETAVAKDKAFGEQAAAYNRDKSELKQLLPGSSVRMKCPKTSSWESIGTVLEMRPDKLSYLIEVQGKMFVRACYMLWPVEEGGVFDASQSQVQGGAQADSQVGVLPRRSERLKLQKEKEEPKSTSKCVAQTMTMPSSANTGALTDFTGSNWQKNTTWNQRATPSGRTQEFCHWGVIISLAVLICCWLQAKGMRRSKNRHWQLLLTISSAIVQGPPSGERSSAPESRSPDVHPSEAAK